MVDFVCLTQGGKWMLYHIDDLHPHDERMPSLMALKGRSLGTLFAAAADAKDTPDEPMDEENEEVLETMEDFSALEDADEEPMDINRMTSEDEREPMDITTMPSEAEGERLDDGFEMLAQMQRRKAQEGVKFVKEKLESPETALDVDGIIRSCLHGAAAMLKDATKEEALKLRKTHRLQLLMDLLSEKHAGGIAMCFYADHRRQSWGFWGSRTPRYFLEGRGIFVKCYHIL